MWADPIDLALAAAQLLCEAAEMPSADQFERVAAQLASARRVREFEQLQQRLVTWEDNIV